MGEAKRKTEAQAETLASVSHLTINLSLDFDQMQDFIARAMAQALYRARPPWLPGERINIDDLRRPAAVLMGILTGGEAALAKEAKRDN